MKISVTEEYYVNITENTTTCILKIKNYENILIPISAVKDLEQFAVQGGKKNTVFDFPREIVAVVKCHPTDKWDTLIGKREARNKAYRRLDSYKEKYMRKLMESLGSIQSKIINEYNNEYNWS